MRWRVGTFSKRATSGGDMATRNKLDSPAQPQEPPLHLKYRPMDLFHVLGQSAVVKSLKQTLASRTRPHCYLFTGPAGTGKTTLGRIVADECDVPPSSIIEVDGASKNGVDDMRALLEPLVYRGFGEHPNKAIIINECQRLSAQAWDSALTTTEEPPEHVYFIFTSTNPAKIPNAMVTRCQVYHLKALHRDDVIDMLEVVVDKERFDTPSDVLRMVADACNGSMRAALTMLAKVHAIEDMRDVADLLQQPEEDAEVIELCRLLVSNRLKWDRLADVLSRMSDVQPETIRIIITAYLSKCVMGSRSERDTRDLLFMLEQFSKPFDPTLKLAPLLLAFGRIMFA